MKTMSVQISIELLNSKNSSIERHAIKDSNNVRWVSFIRQRLVIISQHKLVT